MSGAMDEYAQLQFWCARYLTNIQKVLSSLHCCMGLLSQKNFYPWVLQKSNVEYVPWRLRKKDRTDGEDASSKHIHR